MKAYSQAAVILFVSVVISLGILFSAPEPASAQSFWDSVSCTGTDCQACHFVQLANVIVDWLVRVLLLVFGIVAVVAGFGLVTSAGNPAAKNQAKDRMTNAFIGFLIVLAAWMAVDALLRGLAGDAYADGGSMPWNDIECVKQPELSGYKDDFISLEEGGIVNIMACDPGPGGDLTLCTNQIAVCESKGGIASVNDVGANYFVECAQGGSPELACIEDPSSPGDYDCTAAEAQCMAAEGTPTIVGGVVKCDLPAGVGAGSCDVVNDPSNPCSPSNLACFGSNANNASMVCNVESAGGNNVMSGSDKCKDGTSFSGGVWQVNIMAHSSNIPGCSSNPFTLHGDGAQGGCLDRNAGGACLKWNCTLSDANTYYKCVEGIMNTDWNNSYACKLYDDRGGNFKDWNHTAYNVCKIPL